MVSRTVTHAACKESRPCRFPSHLNKRITKEVCYIQVTNPTFTGRSNTARTAAPALQEEDDTTHAAATVAAGPSNPGDDGDDSTTDASTVTDETPDTPEAGSATSSDSDSTPPPKRKKRAPASHPPSTERRGLKVDHLHPGRAPIRSVQPPPPRRLKLPTVSSSALRRLADRSKVVKIDDILSFGAKGTSAATTAPPPSPAVYLRAVGVVAAYRTYFFPELGVQWAMYTVWLQGIAAGLPTAAIKELDTRGRTLLAQYPGEYHSAADLTESVQDLAAPPSRPAYTPRAPAPYRQPGGSRPYPAGREQRLTCFRWNENRCHNGTACRFVHRCRDCGAPDHPAPACQMPRRPQGNGPRPLMGQQSPAGRF